MHQATALRHQSWANMATSSRMIDDKCIKKPKRIKTARPANLVATSLKPKIKEVR